MGVGFERAVLLEDIFVTTGGFVAWLNEVRCTHVGENLLRTQLTTAAAICVWKACKAGEAGNGWLALV